MSKVNRRKFIAAVGGAIVAAAGYGYYQYFKRPESTTQSPTISPTETLTTSTTSVLNRPPIAAFALGIDSVSGETYYLLEELNPATGSSLESDVFKDKPKWNLNPTTEQVIKFLNHSTDADNDNLSYVWSLNGKEISREKDYSTTFYEGENTLRLTNSDGKLETYMEKKITIDPVQIFSPKKLRNNLLKGIIYIPSMNLEYIGVNRRNLPKERIRLEINDIINEELGCNAISIESDDDDLFFDCAEVALEGNFDVVVVVPRYLSLQLEDVPSRIGELTKKLKPLHEKYRGRLIIASGNEISVDYKGIIEGDNYFLRGYNLGRMRFGSSDVKKVEDAIRQIVPAIRENFDGKIIYKSGPWESWQMDWGTLDIDIIGLNYYWYRSWLGDEAWNPTGTQKFIEGLGSYKKFGKPIWVTEFGSVTTKNGCKHGGAGFSYAIEDEYDAEAQASCIKNYMDLFNKVPAVEACFLGDFIQPNSTEWKLYTGEPFTIENQKKATFSILDYKGPNPLEPGDYTSTRKPAFYMYKSYQRVES